MGGSSFGTLFRVTTFGESHGPALGAVVDGVPAGLTVDAEFIQSELDRRRPGAGLPGSTPRNEADRVKILSGVFETLFFYGFLLLILYLFDRVF